MRDNCRESAQPAGLLFLPCLLLQLGPLPQDEHLANASDLIIHYARRKRLQLQAVV